MSATKSYPSCCSLAHSITFSKVIQLVIILFQASQELDPDNNDNNDDEGVSLHISNTQNLTDGENTAESIFGDESVYPDHEQHGDGDPFDTHTRDARQEEVDEKVKPMVALRQRMQPVKGRSPKGHGPGSGGLDEPHTDVHGGALTESEPFGN